MLIFTNRTLSVLTDERAYEAVFEPGATRLSVASVEANAAGGWAVSDHLPDVDDVDALNRLLPLFAGTRPILVYLHGNNNTPAACFERCAMLASIYDVEVIGFSWASEGFLPDGSDLPGVTSAAVAVDENELRTVKAANRTEGIIQQKIRRYHQAKTNAQDSIDALARFLRLLGTARLHANVQAFTLAAHSLGAHFLQYTLDVPGAAESVGTSHNVALLAPCVRAAGHRAWLANVRPKGQVFVTYNKGDSVLFGAYVADGSQLKLGTDPGPELLQSSAVRYISFSNSGIGSVGGHNYFAVDKLPKKPKKVLSRIFGSALDIRADEYPRQVYPVGCDADLLTCYMGAPGGIEVG